MSSTDTSWKSTSYKNEKQDDNILCKFVANIDVDGDKLTFVDVMGQRTTITGRFLSADLTAGTVLDRDGDVLSSAENGERTYYDSETVRKATLQAEDRKRFT